MKKPDRTVGALLAPRRYRELTLALERARLAAGGLLSDEQESRWADKLDELWWKMSRAEQHAFEEELSAHIAGAWKRAKVVTLPASARDDPLAWRPRWLVAVLVFVCVTLGFMLGFIV